MVLSATAADLGELIGGVAAEANRRRRQRLDTAFNALTSAADTLSW